jgi:hypothetical protein
MTDMRRERLRLHQLRKQLLRDANYTCTACGSSQSLEICHIIPLALGGTSDSSNLTVLCANCHRFMDTGPPELHFVKYLSRLLEQHPDFSQVKFQTIIGGTTRYRADIVARRKTGRGEETVVIECKAISVLSFPRLEAVLAQLTNYAKVVGEARLVLAFPGRASEDTLRELKRRGIEVWDIDRISELFNEQLAKTQDPYFSPIFFNTRARATLQETLINELKACPTGHEGWVEYQKLSGRILDDLFCPPLTRPLEEHADATKANRRDFIFPNYASDGFWLFLRTRYAADYIVVDAKNGKGKINKGNVLQMANYLKSHGVGMFGIILSRQGADGGAKVTMREQWVLHNKLIIVLGDQDVESMLLARAAGGEPTSVLSDQIQQFRLSI